MQTITPVTMFPCPITGKLYKTERGAKNSAKREQERLVQEELKKKEAQKSKEEKEAEVNWLRLNLEDINDLPVLMRNRAKELYDWDLNVSFPTLNFCCVSNSHNCPINGVTNWGGQYKDCPTSYPGWSGRIEGTLTGKVPKLTFMNSISDIITKKFRGLHTATGGPGQPNEYKMSIGFYMFLDDFPKLKEKYEKYIIEKEKEAKNHNALADLEASACDYVSTHPDFLKASALFKRVQMIRDIKYTELFADYQNKNTVTLFSLSDDYQQLKQIFE